MHGNTENISHVPIRAWAGVTSLLTSHRSWNDATFLLKFQTYSISNVTEKFQWRTNTMQMCPLLWLVCPSGRPYNSKKYLWIYHTNFTNFVTNTFILDATKGVIAGLVYRVFWVHCTLQILLSFLHPQSYHQMLLDLFWGVQMENIRSKIS